MNPVNPWPVVRHRGLQCEATVVGELSLRCWLVWGVFLETGGIPWKAGSGASVCRRERDGRGAGGGLEVVVWEWRRYPGLLLLFLLTFLTFFFFFATIRSIHPP